MCRSASAFVAPPFERFGPITLRLGKTPMLRLVIVSYEDLGGAQPQQPLAMGIDFFGVATVDLTGFLNKAE
jgi:hypothetical protein